MKQIINYPSKDGITTIQAYIWNTDLPVKGIIQISHGMIEHVDRYETFANDMNKQGFIVCGNDHLGHGSSIIDKEHLGYFAEKNSSDILIEDVYELTKKMKEEYPTVPYFLLGHSMGSFIARYYATKYGNNLDGLIICGSSFKSSSVLNFGKLLTKITKLYNHGWFYRSPYLNKLTTGNYGKYFNGDKNAWMSKDEEVIRLFATDPRCGFKFTCNGYYTLFDLIKKSCSKKLAKNIPNELPILIISGKDDPVGSFGKDLNKIKSLYNKCGIRNTKTKPYNGLRHELINEPERSIVEHDILQFMNDNLYTKSYQQK